MSNLPTKTDKLTLMHQLAAKKARDLMPRAFAYLGNVLEDGDAPHGARLQAAAMILDRALGKAKEIKHITGSVDINVQHLDALKAINKAFQDEANKHGEIIDVTPLPLSKNGEDANDNKDLEEDGRLDRASTWEDEEADGGEGEVDEAPPSFSKAGA